MSFRPWSVLSLLGRLCWFGVFICMHVLVQLVGMSDQLQTTSNPAIACWKSRRDFFLSAFLSSSTILPALLLIQWLSVVCVLVARQTCFDCCGITGFRSTTGFVGCTYWLARL